VTNLPAVSVVMPVRDEQDSIEGCLRALQSQTYPSDLIEILVVDGRSSDQTRALVEDAAIHDPRIRLLDNPDRITPVALNTGIAAARHDVIVRMDGHSIPAQDFIQNCVAALMRVDAWAVGGIMDRVGHTRTERAIAAATSMPVGIGDAAHNYATTSRYVETVFLGAWHRWVFERVGLFDPELVRDQDDELSYRIRKAGGRIWFDTHIVVRYRPRSSLSSLFGQYRQYSMFKVRVFQKHPGAARWRHLVPPIWIAGLAVGGMLAVVSPLALIPLAACGPVYLGVVAAGAARRKEVDVSRVSVFAALITLHAAYGIGFWQGLVRFAPRWFRDRRGTIPALEVRRLE
jgi:succinoglycan biosynthesis protein ExoA